MALIQNVLDTLVSRRSFLKGSAAAISAASFALNATAIAESNTLKATGEETIPAAAEPVVGEDGGKWVAAPCWHNCGGKCLVKAYVKDGVILRQKTDDTTPMTSTTVSSVPACVVSPSSIRRAAWIVSSTR